jgi:hypothetical protein
MVLMALFFSFSFSELMLYLVLVELAKEFEEADA